MIKFLKKKKINFSKKFLNSSVKSKLKTYIKSIKNYNFNDFNKFSYLFKFILKKIDIISSKKVFKKKKISNIKKHLSIFIKSLIFF